MVEQTVNPWVAKDFTIVMTSSAEYESSPVGKSRSSRGQRKHRLSTHEFYRAYIPEVGSSKNKTSGEERRDIAMFVLFSWPPLNPLRRLEPMIVFLQVSRPKADIAAYTLDSLTACFSFQGIFSSAVYMSISITVKFSTRQSATVNGE